MIKVDCYSGYKGDERPTAFFIGERRFEVKEVLDKWYGPDYEYFKIRADDGNEYILKHSIKDDFWTLEFTETK